MAPCPACSRMNVPLGTQAVGILRLTRSRQASHAARRPASRRGTPRTRCSGSPTRPSAAASAASSTAARPSTNCAGSSSTPTAADPAPPPRRPDHASALPHPGRQPRILPATWYPHDAVDGDPCRRREIGDATIAHLTPARFGPSQPYGLLTFEVAKILNRPSVDRSAPSNANQQWCSLRFDAVTQMTRTLRLAVTSGVPGHAPPGSVDRRWFGVTGRSAAVDHRMRLPPVLRLLLGVNGQLLRLPLRRRRRTKQQPSPSSLAVMGGRCPAETPWCPARRGRVASVRPKPGSRR